MSEQEAQAQVILGVGPFPPELDRLNLNAAVWNGLWAMTYSIWPWFWGFMLLRFGGIALITYLTRSVLGPSSVLPVTLFWFIVNWVIEGVFAFRANRLLWQRRQSPASTSPPLALEKFERTQRKWVILGLAFIVVPYLIPPYSPLSTSSKVVLIGTPLFLGVLLGFELLRARLRQS